jgi:ribosomal protein L13E
LSEKTRKAPKSARRKPKETKKAAEPKAAVPKQLWIRPTAPVPVALVSARRGPVMIEREGRGFSMGELDEASVPHRLIAEWGLQRDVRRRSVLKTNVDSLKKWFKTAKRREAEAPAEPKAEVASVPKKRAPRKKKDTKTSDE